MNTEDATYPTGTTHVYEGRPAKVTNMTRAYCAGKNARRGMRSAYTVYTVYFLDGADAGVPFAFPAGEFNGKSRCPICGKRSVRCECVGL
jgi:hypothetical protein